MLFRDASTSLAMPRLTIFGSKLYQEAVYLYCCGTYYSLPSSLESPRPLSWLALRGCWPRRLGGLNANLRTSESLSWELERDTTPVRCRAARGSTPASSSCKLCRLLLYELKSGNGLDQPVLFVQQHSSEHVYTAQEQNGQSGGSFMMRHCREWFNDS